MKETRFDRVEVDNFCRYLREEEKSEATIEKYRRDTLAFLDWCDGRDVTKDAVIAYKSRLSESGYRARSINSMLASLNSYFGFIGCEGLKIRLLKIQPQIFRPEEKELSRREYENLCKAAKDTGNDRLYLLLMTICGTGIRVGELKFITAEAVRCGQVTVSLKGKTRVILIPKRLSEKLSDYMTQHHIEAGPVFVTKSGKPLNRTNVWREMKKICTAAKVNPSKVFPHNLRHLFARIFYNIDRDIVKLADILGHSNINTTRIYIISTGVEHRQKLEMMRLIL